MDNLALRVMRFLQFFHKQEGIDDRFTNHSLVERLFLAEFRRDGLSRFVTNRSSGVTRTIQAFVEYMGLIHERPMLVVSQWPDASRFPGARVVGWRRSIRGFHPAPFAILDKPFEEAVLKSVTELARARRYLETFPYPGLLIDQTENAFFNIFLRSEVIP